MKAECHKNAACLNVMHRDTSVKTVIAVLAAIQLLVSCSHQPDSDATLQAKIVGMWTAAGLVIPHDARASDAMITISPDGSATSRFSITFADGQTHQQTQVAKWHIENGFMIEQQTNVDGAAIDTKTREEASKIIKLDSHELILSNQYAPRRVFLRKE
jgi:hypothetical protein